MSILNKNNFSSGTTSSFVDYDTITSHYPGPFQEFSSKIYLGSRFDYATPQLQIANLYKDSGTQFVSEYVAPSIPTNPAARIQAFNGNRTAALIFGSGTPNVPANNSIYARMDEIDVSDSVTNIRNAIGHNHWFNGDVVTEGTSAYDQFIYFVVTALDAGLISRKTPWYLNASNSLASFRLTFTNEIYLEFKYIESWDKLFLLVRNISATRADLYEYDTSGTITGSSPTSTINIALDIKTDFNHSYFFYDSTDDLLYIFGFQTDDIAYINSSLSLTLQSTSFNSDRCTGMARYRDKYFYTTDGVPSYLIESDTSFAAFSNVTLAYLARGGGSIKLFDDNLWITDNVPVSSNVLHIYKYYEAP